MSLYKSKVTIILPIKDRAILTLRWLDYAIKKEIGCKIIICDGGYSDNIEKTLKNKMHPYSSLNLDYYRSPPCVSAKTYNYRIYESLTKVKTQFVVISANDDFLILDGLNAAAKFLLENNDYSSARGQSYTFQVIPEVMSKYNVYGYMRSMKYFPYFEPNKKEIIDVIEKLNIYYKALSMTTFCDMKRTSNEVKNWKILTDNPQLDMWFSAYLLDSLVMIDGNNKNLSALFNMKQSNPKGNDGATLVEYSTDYFDTYFKETWFRQFDDMLTIIVNNLTPTDPDNFSENITILKKSFLNGVIRPRLIGEALNYRYLGRYATNWPTKLTGRIEYEENIFWMIEDILEKIRLLTVRVINRLRLYNIFDWKQRPGLLPIGPHQEEMKWFREFLKNNC